MRKRAIVIVLDSVGVGQTPDACDYGDTGANTLQHISQSTNLYLPNLGKLGLGNLTTITNVPPSTTLGAYAKMESASRGKDTLTGHWEIAGVITATAFTTYKQGFPKTLLDTITTKTGYSVIDAGSVSGTKVIVDLGKYHLKTGDLIVYTSSDSVLQVAAHESIISAGELQRVSKIISDIVTPYNIARVIARPFIGNYPHYVRTYERMDFVPPPPNFTMLDSVNAAGLKVTAIGKISDIYANRGVSESIHTNGNADCMQKILDEIKCSPSSLIMANLVDFDMLYGHRRDPIGYARALEEFDQWLPSLQKNLEPEDIVFITADHGNDPTFVGFNHTREFVPMLAFGPMVMPNTNLGLRKTYSDLGKTVTEFLQTKTLHEGESFASSLVGAHE